MLIEELIKEVENHSGKPFDFKKRRHLFLLNAKIERLHSDELRILGLVTEALKSKSGENSLINDGTHYARKRYNN